MIEYCKKLIENLNEEIDDLVEEFDNSMPMIEQAIGLILNRLSEIKDIVVSKKFDSVEEEIYFFKKVKPGILSKLIYYNSIYKIESKKPYGGSKAISKYLNNEISKIKKYFDNNLEFYRYYRTDSTYLDHKYFVRGKHDIKLNLDTYYFESDHNFTTSHDYKLAKIIANDLIQLYIENQTYKNENGSKGKEAIKPLLKWTESKRALIELIYALYAKGAFNNGNTDIKEMAKIAESIFDIDLGDYYHTFLEIRNRKINRTKYLDSLKEALLKRMDDEDEK